MRVIGILALIALGLATWKVHAVRAQLADDDADPVLLEKMRSALASLPLELSGGEYVGRKIEVRPEVLRESGADTYTSMEYVSREGRKFDLYIGGAIRNQENFHAPTYCMPSAGWEVVEETTVPFTAYDVPQEAPTTRRLLLQYGAARTLVHFWFQAGSRVADHEWTIRYYRFLDLLAGEPLRPTVIVTVSTPVMSDVREAETAVASFLRSAGPSLQSSIAGALEN